MAAATTAKPPVSAAAVLPVRGMPAGSLGFPWWNDTVFYAIFVRSFHDSDGDGIGDIQGVIEKLDYLNDGNPKTTDDLGVHRIWLMPIFPSPSYHGYDVVDYFDIDPEYGTMADFRELLRAAHARGIAVIMDLPLNHIASEHPWFQAAKDPSSPSRHWYIWSQTDPGFRGPWDRDVWHESPTGYYIGLFAPTMPDLNYQYPDVDAAMKEVARFWLEEAGVDGFRLDAIIHVVNVALRVGETVRVRSTEPAVYAILRASPAETMLVVINLSTEPVRDYRLSLPEGPLEGRYHAVPLLGPGTLPPRLEASARGGFAVDPAPLLEGGQTAILQLQPW